MMLWELRDGKAAGRNAEAKFDLSCDVLVVGLGSAGAQAALSAAREGASVIGIERGNASGGMCTRGSVNFYYYGCGEGFFREIDARSRDLSETAFLRMGVHPHAKLYALEERLLRENVAIYYDSFATGLFIEDGRVIGVRALLPNGLTDIRCEMLIDATSEGHLIRMTNVPYTFGRPTDEKAQPFSSVRVFVRKDGGMGRTNHDSGYMNQYDPEEISRATLDAHALHVADLGNGETFLCLSEQIGVREGLLFEGEEKLTLTDILDQNPVAKPLVTCYSDIDKHGQDLAFDDDPYQSWFSLSNLATVTAQISLPMGCVIPKGIKGMLSAGRCLSVDSYASSAIRMVRDMQRIGEACGVLAVLSAKTGGDALAADYDALRENLEKRNCVNFNPEISLGFGTPKTPDDYTPVRWLTEREELIAALSTNTPGVALWSCRRIGAEAAYALLGDCLSSDNELLRKHTALALGLAGEKAALPVLREIVRNRSAYFFEDCRRSNQLRSAIAIALCGKLGDSEILPELCKLVSNPDEFERPLYHQYTRDNITPEFAYKFAILRDFNQVYYQHFSHAVVALLRIRENRPECDADVRKALAQALSGDAYIKRITSNPPGSAEYKAALHIREFACRRIPGLSL